MNWKIKDSWFFWSWTRLYPKDERNRNHLPYLGKKTRNKRQLGPCTKRKEVFFSQPEEKLHILWSSQQKLRLTPFLQTLILTQCQGSHSKDGLCRDYTKLPRKANECIRVNAKHFSRKQLSVFILYIAVYDNSFNLILSL